jgi:hypothetical protein
MASTEVRSPFFFVEESEKINMFLNMLEIYSFSKLEVGLRAKHHLPRRRGNPHTPSPFGNVSH